MVKSPNLCFGKDVFLESISIKDKNRVKRAIFAGKITGSGGCNMKRYISAFLCFAMVLVLCSCAATGSAVSEKENLLAGYTPSDTVTQYDFTSGEDIIPEGYDRYKEAATDFALSLFAQTADDDSNMIIAPVSVMTAMSLLANGASDDTLAELKNTLTDGMDVTALNTHNHYLSQRLSAFNSEEGSYKSVNSLWFNDAFDVRSSFLQPAVNYYDAGVFRIPLLEADAIDKINGWISENTDGEITDAVEQIDPDTMALVINAVLFDDAWATPYTDNQLYADRFHGTSGDTDVTYMTSEEFYLSTSYAEGFVKSFKNLPCKFAAILPPVDMPLSEFADSLTYNRLTALLNSQQPMEYCKASLPQFSFDTKLDLKDSLKVLGIEDAFDAEKADFSALSNTGDVYLSSVTQDAFIEVGALGAKAGAATVGSVDITSAPSDKQKEVVLDRPFIFLIYDNESNIPVFIGAVNNV